MAKNVENLSLNMVGLLAEDEKQYYVDEHIYIAMNAQDFGLKHLRRDQPYRVDEGRVMMAAPAAAPAVTSNCNPSNLFAFLLSEIRGLST